MPNALRTLLASFLMLLAATGAWAQPPEPDCSNPRSAADSMFDWLTGDVYDPSKAAACFDTPASGSGDRLAVQLLQLLDARGLYVPVSGMSADPNYEDDLGRHFLVPLPDFPQLSFTRDEVSGEWRYSRDTLESVPSLYARTFSPISVWFQSQLPSIFYSRFLGLHLWQYLYGLSLLAIAWMGGQLIRVLLRGQVHRLVTRAGLKLDERTYRRTNGPMVVLVVLGIVLWGLTDLQLPIQISAVLHKALSVCVWLAALLVVSRFVDVGAKVANSWADTTESRLDDQLIPLLRQATQLVVLVIGSLYVADALGIDVWKLAAGVGIGGLAFALAAQDTVANVFGSVNIFVDRPFQIGDWVKIGDVEGVVEEVGFRSTRVRTFYNSLVTIPNSAITNANVDNLGERTRRRVKFTLGLTYDTPPDKVAAYVEGVRAILTAHPSVQASYEVHLYNLGDSAIEILVYYHLVVPGWHEELATRSQNILEFIRLAERLNVSFAFPSTSVYVESTPERPMRPQAAMSLAELEQVAREFGPEGALARPGGPAFAKNWSVQARGIHDNKGSADDGG
jgi:MscS family membrane protein